MADVLTAEFVEELTKRAIVDIVQIAAELVDQLTDARGFGPLHRPLSRQQRIARHVMDSMTFVHQHLAVINPGEMSRRETEFMRDMRREFAS